MAVAVQLRQDLTKNQRLVILRRWENVTFRIYGMFDKDARTAVGEYVRLAWRITKEQLTAEQILAGLAAIGSEFPITAAVKNLENSDCYTNWQEALRYFFYRYEEYLAQVAGQNYDNAQWAKIWENRATDSIEHILPQSSGAARVVHRLGNLVLLPPKLNSKLGAKTPSNKAKDYGKTGLLIAQEVVPLLSNWTASAISKRERSLLQWALNEWSD